MRDASIDQLLNIHVQITRFSGHPVYDAATCNDARAAVFVPNTTKTPGSSIADLANPLFREFHEALCQYNLIPTSS